MSFPSRIYLTGFMASGKSTVGPVLADRLGYGFIDLDDEIERRARSTIPDIFKKEGEAGFRKRERKALHEAARLEQVVVSTGGGALVDPASMELARQTGAIVYLSASAETILERVGRRPAGRPLLAGRAGSRAEAHLRQLLETRRPFYERSDIAVSVDGHDVADIVREIMLRLTAPSGEKTDDDAE